MHEGPVQSSDFQSRDSHNMIRTASCGDHMTELFKASKKVNHFESLRNLFDTHLEHSMIL